MAIFYETADSSYPKFKRRDTSQWIKKVVEQYHKRVGDITYIFCSDEKILEINQQYLNHDYYTDIITFDYTQDEIVSGDLFISLETVKTNSEKFGTSYEEELYRVMIHGILHLCGFGDKSPEEEKEMRERENEVLKFLENQLKH